MNQHLPFRPGQKVKHLRVLDRLGSGGMGVVYAAFDETLERKVALKVLHRERHLDPDARARFRREARLLSQIRHPNVCQLHEFFEEDGVQYLVMELAEGEPLSAVHQGLPFQERLRLAEQVAMVLEAGHRRGILHRDLKPDNIMIDGLRVKVLDFGLARLLEDEIATVDLRREDGGPQSVVDGTPAIQPVMAPTSPVVEQDLAVLNTGAGRVLGTPSYMSPEQASGDPVSPASDLFALGMLLHFLFSKQSAYKQGLSQDELIERAAQAKVRPPVGARSDVQRLILQLQRRDPGERPSAGGSLLTLRAIKTRNKRWLRHGGAAALALVLIGGTAKYLVDLRRERSAATEASELAKRARAEAESTSEFLVEIFEGVEPLRVSPREQRVGDLVAQARRELERNETIDPIDRARLYQSLGRVYQALADREAAGAMYEEAELLRREHLGQDDPTRAISLAYAAAMRRSEIGSSETSFAHAQEAVRVLAERKTDYPGEWASAVSALVVQYQDRKQWDEAENLLDQELVWVMDRCGDDRRWLRLELQRLHILGDRGEGPRALTRRQELGPRVRHVFGEHSLEYLWHEQHIAHLLKQSGRSDESIEILQAQLARIEPIADQTHEVVTVAWGLLASALAKVGEHERGVTAARRAFEGTLARTGHDSVEPAAEASHYAYLLNQVGEYERAERLILEWLPILEEHFGDQGFFVLEARHFLKQALLGQGRSDEAAALGSVH